MSRPDKWVLHVDSDRTVRDQNGTRVMLKGAWRSLSKGPVIQCMRNVGVTVRRLQGMSYDQNRVYVVPSWAWLVFHMSRHSTSIMSLGESLEWMTKELKRLKSPDTRYAWLAEIILTDGGSIPEPHPWRRDFYVALAKEILEAGWEDDP